MKHIQSMKPQDILVLLGVLQAPMKWRHADLAMELGLSQSEVTTSLERSRLAGLIDDDKRTVFRKALLEFIEHGLRYVFPAKPGPIVRGVPTAYSAPPLSDTIRTTEMDTMVWPSPDGYQRGQAIEPLYPSVPAAAMRNPQLHMMLALIDAIRIGQARERTLAINALRDTMNREVHGQEPSRK
ncbi:MAG: hypothetical protein H7338_14155 [Candidatus Sericytochromatia bacterium]|nr:hypothetical protein [Candidatus Sericytochromatia bacterium]